MDLEGTLKVLHSWLGEEIEVSAHGGDGSDPLVAVSVQGRLRSAEDIAGGRGPGESLQFVLEDGEGDQVASFMLYDGCFGGAGWLKESEEVLEIRSGVIWLLIGPTHP